MDSFQGWFSLTYRSAGLRNPRAFGANLAFVVSALGRNYLKTIALLDSSCALRKPRTDQFILLLELALPMLMVSVT